MKKIALFTLLLYLVFSFGQQSFAQSTTTQKQELISKFRDNNKTDHKVAYEAAKEFLRQFPDDLSEDAEYVRKWVAAYEKVGGSQQNSNSNADANNSQNNQQNQPQTSKEPTLSETISWMRKTLDVQSFSGTSNRRHSLSINQKLSNFDDCSLEIEFKSKYNQPGKPDFDIKPYQSELIVKTSFDLRKVSIYAPEKDNKNQEYSIYPYILNVEPLGVKGSFTQIIDGVDTSSGSVPISYLLFQDKEIAERFYKALNHAIKLCKETKSSEPF